MMLQYHMIDAVSRIWLVGRFTIESCTAYACEIEWF